jgi:hypothetical protein
MCVSEEMLLSIASNCSSLERLGLTNVERPDEEVEDAEREPALSAAGLREVLVKCELLRGLDLSANEFHNFPIHASVLDNLVCTSLDQLDVGGCFGLHGHFLQNLVHSAPRLKELFIDFCEQYFDSTPSELIPSLLVAAQELPLEILSTSILYESEKDIIALATALTVINSIRFGAVKALKGDEIFCQVCPSSALLLCKWITMTLTTEEHVSFLSYPPSRSSCHCGQVGALSCSPPTKTADRGRASAQVHQSTR